jgi:sterol desaturase/sphingolipid hydroxylase (fatty acid hydroxylase superfamily)
MTTILLTLLITYIVASLFGYVTHWALHQTWMGRFYNAHMTHHLTLYPATEFSSDSYKDAGKDSTLRFFAVASLPLIVIPITLSILGIIPLKIILSILIMEAFVGFFNDYLHNAYHINNHWIGRLPIINTIFFKLIDLHYVHHVKMESNFGIFAFHWDRLFKTFKRS